MTSLSSLNTLHQTGLFGNYQNKNENELITISEVKNIKIIQIVHYKKSNVKEINKKNYAKVTINKEEETTSEKPVAEQSTQSKPEGLPEKFNSVEDLAKSYSELEKKLGDNKEEAPKEDAPKTETKNDLD